MNLLERRQYEEAAANDDAAAARAHVEAAVVDLHTSGPGIVQSFDAAKQTAVVKPVVQKFFRGQGFKPLPPLMDVPVQFPRGGGFVLTFPVQQGDECLLVFAERAIDHWHAMGGVQPPSDFRTHSLSDAFAIMGVSSIPKAIQSFNASAVELRSLDGAAKVQIDGGGNITVESSSGDITAQSATGTIKLNAPTSANALMNGVLIGADPCPILGATHGALGGGCARVFGGKT
jgi:hypothetical protein